MCRPGMRRAGMGRAGMGCAWVMCARTVRTAWGASVAWGCFGSAGMDAGRSSCVLSRGKSVDVRAGVSTLAG